MPTKVMDTTGQLVRARDGRVLVILWGADAVAAAGDWSDRGYRVDPVDRGFLLD